MDFVGDAWMVARLLIVFLIVLVFRCFGLGWYLLLWLLGDMVCFVLICLVGVLLAGFDCHGCFG